MNRVLPLLALALASAVAGYLLYMGLAGRQPADDGLPPLPRGPQSAEFAPEYRLPDIDGQLRSSDEWAGSFQVVNFWATWCPPCIREIPVLIEVQEAYRERGVNVIGIAIDETEAVAAFADRFDFNYPVLIGQDEAMTLANRFVDGFIGLPFTVFTDRDGRIREVHTGELHREDIDRILAGLL